jgi:DNA-directed RNA polymerase subunit RPC12/RpoP
MPTNLRFAFVYLCGPIDRVADAGKDWRQMLAPWLQSELGSIVLDPTNKQATGHTDEDAEWRDSIQKLQDNKAYDELTNAIKPVRNYDLRCVDKSDYLVCNYDTSVQMCGTMEEIFIANKQLKPIVFHCPQGKHNMPRWLFSVFPHELFFDSWNAVKAYLLHIHASPQDKITTYDRWKFFNVDKQVSQILQLNFNSDWNRNGSIAVTIGVACPNCSYYPIQHYLNKDYWCPNCGLRIAIM